jgi:hypothetical protein
MRRYFDALHSLYDLIFFVPTTKGSDDQPKINTGLARVPPTPPPPTPNPSAVHSWVKSQSLWSSSSGYFINYPKSSPRWCTDRPDKLHRVTHQDTRWAENITLSLSLRLLVCTRPLFTSIAESSSRLSKLRFPSDSLIALCLRLASVPELAVLPESYSVSSDLKRRFL